MSNKYGRPKKNLNNEVFENLCSIHCTKNEICSVFKVDEKTVTRWCIDTYGLSFSDAYKRYSANGKISLRRAQWESALNGNRTMLIWLGKNVLNQKDFRAVDIESKTSVGLGSDYSKLSVKELDEKIAMLASKLYLIKDVN